MKAVIFGILLYFAYRLFIAPLLLAGKSGPEKINRRDKKPKRDIFKDEDYIDYEEVD